MRTIILVYVAVGALVVGGTLEVAAGQILRGVRDRYGRFWAWSLGVLGCVLLSVCWLPSILLQIKNIRKGG